MWRRGHGVPDLNSRFIAHDVKYWSGDPQPWRCGTDDSTWSQNASWLVAKAELGMISATISAYLGYLR